MRCRAPRMSSSHPRTLVRYYLERALLDSARHRQALRFAWWCKSPKGQLFVLADPEIGIDRSTGQPEPLDRQRVGATLAKIYSTENKEEGRVANVPPPNGDRPSRSSTVGVKHGRGSDPLHPKRPCELSRRPRRTCDTDQKPGGVSRPRLGRRNSSAELVLGEMGCALAGSPTPRSG